VLVALAAAALVLLGVALERRGGRPAPRHGRAKETHRAVATRPPARLERVR
jgi:hypothetical protein